MQRRAFPTAFLATLPERLPHAMGSSAGSSSSIASWCQYRVLNTICIAICHQHYRAT